MFDVFRLADVAHIFIMAFRLANIYFVSENSHRPRKGYKHASICHHKAAAVCISVKIQEDEWRFHIREKTSS